MDLLDSRSSAALRKMLEERFGIRLEGLAFLRLGKGRVHVATPEAAALARQLPAVLAGLPCARESDPDRHRSASPESAPRFKPSTALLQLFGARDAFVDLSSAQAREFIAGRDCSCAGPEGFVAARYRNRVLGCGLLKGGMLKSQVPRAKRIERE